MFAGFYSWRQPAPTSVQHVAAQLLALAACGATPLPAGGAIAPTMAAVEAQSYLQTARGVALRTISSERLSDADLAGAESAAGALPLAARGLLYFAAGVLRSEATYEDDRCTSSVPALVALLRRISTSQTGRAPAVAKALGGALSAMGARRPELAECTQGALVDLLLAGHDASVLDAAEAWATTGADPSLVRAFALRVLERAGPPYSSAFVRPLLRLVHAGKMAVAKKAGMLMGTGAIERLREFAVECLDAVNFVPPLSDTDVDLLERLAA